MKTRKPVRRPGRPPIDPLLRANVALYIRCTEVEREIVREAAEREGASLSEWVREVALKAASARASNAATLDD